MKDTDDAGMEAGLEKLLRTGLPPARDPLFRIAVAQRRERQSVRRRTAAAVGAGVVVTVVVSLAMTALVTPNAEAIDTWLTDDLERVVVALSVVATTCFTIAAAWLAGADRALDAMRALRTRL